MQELVFSTIANNCRVSVEQIRSVKRLFDQQATIPFISRYRKEATGNLDEVQIGEISKQFKYFEELEKRKEYVLRVINEACSLTPQLKNKILNIVSADELEDVFLPYKPTKKTRASKARAAGLESIALQILGQRLSVVDTNLEGLISDLYPTIEDVKQGAKDIIADIISTTSDVREYLRGLFMQNGLIVSKRKGTKIDIDKFEDYVDYSEPIRKIKNHRLLAVLRGVKEGILSVRLEVELEGVMRYLHKRFLKGSGISHDLVLEALEDSYKRLIHPSLETEIINKLKERADEEAIKLFAGNVRQLLMAPPLGEQRVLALDPGFRTGCKVVCLDEKGDLLHNETIYPHAPQHEVGKSLKKIQSLIDAYRPDAIAIGNGTASKETEKFIRKIRFNKDLQVFMVNEDGASVYSASKNAREEFPEYDVTVRGAISIGRRLLDPLAELIKIDPKSIGVGQYQHDVNQKKMKEELDKTVFQCVNDVGVNVNTASYHLLSYVSGLNSTLAKNIVAYRSERGKFTLRQELKNVARLGAKAFEQSAGFLRIQDGDNVLDNTAVHPESYDVVKQIAKNRKCKIEQLLNTKLELSSDEVKMLVSQGVGEFTLKDIVNELQMPGRDPRGLASVFTFNQQINTIEDLKEGMLLPGVITNITDFGAFVDIGIKQNGLVHISEITNRYISHPSEVLHINDQVILRVKSVEIDRNRIQLSMKDTKCLAE